MTSPPDRLQLLFAQTVLDGIDFVYVHPDQVTLDIYFLIPPDKVAPSLVGAITSSQITIAPATTDVTPVALTTTLAWESPPTTPVTVLRVTTTTPGGFGRYELTITHPQIDGYYSRASVNFKAACPSELDCKPPPHVCPPDDSVDYPIDYTARDYSSLRQALLDFAAVRYPKWTDRLEPDVGMMLAEVMSALGDEMAYYQDRIAREAYLETATQRRSVRRHTRLVDYPMHDGLAASAWLDVQVLPVAPAPPPTTPIVTMQAGDAVWAIRDGAQINFAVGRALAEMLTTPPAAYPVAWACNELVPHLWDDRPRAVCLHVGATALDLAGHHSADLVLTDTSEPMPGRWVVLLTEPTDPGIPARAWPVRLVSAIDMTDVVLGVPITHVRWEAAHATPFELDLQTLVVHGNLVPITAGAVQQSTFYLDDPGFVPPAGTGAAVERRGPNGTISYLWSLPGSDASGLAMRGATPQTALPELQLVDASLPTEPWTWQPSFLGAISSAADATDFVLDDGTWRRVVGYQRTSQDVVQVDYASDAGRTIRFGDGVFGRQPAPRTVFRASYRLGNGQVGNLPAGAITFAAPAYAGVLAVSNPLPSIDGVDPETLASVQQQAPEAYQAITYRAVRPEDYAEAADRLPWVQRAGAAFRWTGSWVSAFVTPDPLGTDVLSSANRADLDAQLDRFRQAGRDAFTRDPTYADLDLKLSICVESSAYRADVVQAVMQRLVGANGFFAPDNFTFGTPLERSMLEVAVQAVPGVRAVEDITLRRRGWFDWQPFDAFVYQPAADEVIRVDNDLQHPDRGSVQLVMVEGGA